MGKRFLYFYAIDEHEGFIQAKIEVNETPLKYMVDLAHFPRFNSYLLPKFHWYQKNQVGKITPHDSGWWVFYLKPNEKRVRQYFAWRLENKRNAAIKELEKEKKMSNSLKGDCIER